MTKLNPNNGNETKSDIFHRTYSILTLYTFLISMTLKNEISQLYD